MGPRRSAGRAPGTGHPPWPRTTAPGQAWAQPRDPSSACGWAAVSPAPLLTPRSPPCGPKSPGRSSVRRLRAAGRWLLGGGAAALRLFPTCARAVEGTGRAPGGGAGLRGAGPAGRSLCSVCFLGSRLRLPPSWVPAWAEPCFRPSWSLQGAVLSLLASSLHPRPNTSSRSGLLSLSRPFPSRKSTQSPIPFLQRPHPQARWACSLDPFSL